jgi:hypothetical protein
VHRVGVNVSAISLLESRTYLNSRTLLAILVILSIPESQDSERDIFQKVHWYVPVEQNFPKSLHRIRVLPIPCRTHNKYHTLFINEIRLM